tara:strand:- start:489 stop:866 length:378 start_codon:yes stop_codon:yes gene_type:complete
MIILQSTTSSQTIKFIPREYESSGSNIYNISIKNETTNSEVYNADTNSFTLEDYFYKYSAAFTRVKNSVTVSSFDQDTFYILTIKKSGSVIYKDKIFCTNQTISSYSVNENEYTQKETTNDFIVL